MRLIRQQIAPSGSSRNGSIFSKSSNSKVSTNSINDDLCKWIWLLAVEVKCATENRMVSSSEMGINYSRPNRLTRWSGRSASISTDGWLINPEENKTNKSSDNGRWFVIENITTEMSSTWINIYDPINNWTSWNVGYRLINSNDYKLLGTLFSWCGHLVDRT